MVVVVFCVVHVLCGYCFSVFVLRQFVGDCTRLQQTRNYHFFSLAVLTYGNNSFPSPLKLKYS